jgi:hypothetical protein
MAVRKFCGKRYSICFLRLLLSLFVFFMWCDGMVFDLDLTMQSFPNTKVFWYMVICIRYNMKWSYVYDLLHVAGFLHVLHCEINTIVVKMTKQPSNAVNICSSNTHVRSKVYQELYHYVVYIANERCNIIIIVGSTTTCNHYKNIKKSTYAVKMEFTKKQRKLILSDNGENFGKFVINVINLYAKQSYFDNISEKINTETRSRPRQSPDMNGTELTF